MHVLRTVDELADIEGPIIVPTMGALHAGHRSLIDKAATFGRQRNRPVLVSIFVNPTQFGPSEDFSQYPRPLEHDLSLAAKAGATAAFVPSEDVIYPANHAITVPPLPPVATQPKLEDAHRPDHFAGVCQVVARLFDLTQPAVAIFGEKDYQQLQVICAMVKHQQSDARRWLGLQIEAASTVREQDGLALSSRNAYLGPDERRRAIGLFRAMQDAQAAQTPADAERIMLEVLADHQLDTHYAVARDANTLMPIEDYSQPARLLIAARCGNTRLIDNMPSITPDITRTR